MNPFKHLRVLVCGEVGIDRYLSGTSLRKSPEADVPVISHMIQMDYPGMSANVAKNLESLGAYVELFTVLGRSASGLEQLFPGMTVLDTSRPTITKTRVLSNGRQVARLDEELTHPLNDDLQDKFLKILKNEVDRFDAVVLQDYGKGLWTKTTLEIVKFAESRGKYVFVDPFKGRDIKEYSNATLIKPNQLEADDMSSNAATPAEMAVELRKSSNSMYCVVTCGAQGMWGASHNEVSCSKTSGIIPLDVTGCGDTVLAVLTLMLTTGRSLIDAMRLANKAAGLTLGTLGPTQVTWDDLKE